MFGHFWTKIASWWYSKDVFSSGSRPLLYVHWENCSIMNKMLVAAQLRKQMKQLKKDLRDAGVDIPIGKQHIADLWALALQHGIQMTIKKQRILPGWEEKPKGVLLILWKCRLIAESNYKTMTLNGCENPLTGQIDKSMSLWCLLGKCTDFQKELNALQALGVDLGVIVDARCQWRHWV